MATILLASLSGCASGGPIPKWDGQIWAGDSEHQSIRRSQEPDPAKNEIKASDPRFNDYVAISYSDFERFYATYVLGCSKWKDGLEMMSESEANSRLRLFWLDMRRAQRRMQRLKK